MAIITKLGRLPIANWGKGTIVANDQKLSLLEFRVLHWGISHVYFGVKGEALNVKGWADRVGAEVVTKEEIIAARDVDVPATSICNMGHEHPTIKPLITGEVI